MCQQLVNLTADELAHMLACLQGHRGGIIVSAVTVVQTKACASGAAIRGLRSNGTVNAVKQSI